MDPKLAVQENGPDIARGHQVVQVRIRPAQVLDTAFQLRVHRDQLFVDRLKLFLARLQLLGR